MEWRGTDFMSIIEDDTGLIWAASPEDGLVAYDPTTGHLDLNALKAEFGADLCFHSAVDNQQTLAFGTPDEVRDQVRMLIDTLASDGTGFIIGPCHNLQAVSPTANILALYETANEYGRFD